MTALPSGDARWDARIDVAARAAGAAAALIGAVYFALWLGGVPPRWSANGVITVKTNMALAQVLAGAALILLVGRGVKPRRRATATVAAAVVLVIGASTLAEHLFRVDLGIDQLLATEPPGAPGTVAPNRMGPPGATGLTLLGVGLLALASRRRGAALCGGAAFCVVLMPAVGLLYGASGLHERPSVTGIAGPAIVALLLLSAGLTLAHPDDGPIPLLWRRDPGGVLLRWMVLPAVLLPIVAGFVRLMGERSGLYTTSVGTGLFAVSLVAMFLLLLWRVARRLSASAGDVDRAVAEMRHAAELLELGDAFFEIDRDWRILRVNQNQERMSGKPRSESVGRALWKVWPETAEAGSAYWREYHRCMDERVPVQFEAHFAPLGIWTGVTAYPTSAGGMAVFVRDVSDRKRAEQALRDSDEKLRLAKDAANMGAWDWNLATGELVWSDRCKALFGLPRETAMTYEVFQASLHPEDRDRIDAEVRAALAGHGEYDAEMRVPFPDGTIRWIATKGRAFFDARGVAVRMAGMALDVTERKVAEQALRDSEARARTVSENIRDSLVLLQAVPGPGSGIADWRYVDANEGACRLLGVARASLVGRTMSEVLPDRSAAAAARLRRVLATGVPERYEAEYRDEFLVVTLFRIDARTVGSAALDVTDLKRAEQSLRDEEQQASARAAELEAILGCVAEAVLVYDAEGRIVRSNASAAALLDYRPQEREVDVAARVTSTRYEWLAEDGHRLEPDESAAVRASRYGETHRGSVVRMRGPGGPGADRWLSVGAGPLFVGGKRVGAVVSLSDITERKEAEAALRAANEQLRETDRRRTEFLGVLSHELRNPLAPIRNSIFVLDKLPAESPQATRAREVIRRQTEHLTRLVDDLLDVTRISRGKVQLHREVVDLRSLVRRTCEDHRALFEDGDVALHLELPAAPVWADVDATRIAQVIGNLLNNANKFTPPGGAVTLRLRPGDGDAEVCVRDTGTGMNPEQLAHMFEPFAQEDRSLARTRGGLGLGLALSKGLVELHGGAITARSGGPGQGAEFTITLPLAARTSGIAAVPASALDRPGSSRRVLIIEDNVDAARTLADVLEVLGHDVTVARDGRTGIALARELKPDVVVCDLGLPDVDGYEIARTMRQDAALRAIRLIALSGYAQPEDRNRAREAGFDAHLPKPAPLDDLAALIA